MKKIRLLINFDFAEYKKGTEFEVKTKDGIILDPFWRARLKDSEIDNCVSIVKPKPKSKVKIEQEQKE